jgi:hypothetical protein
LNLQIPLSAIEQVIDCLAGKPQLSQHGHFENGSKLNGEDVSLNKTCCGFILWFRRVVRVVVAGVLDRTNEGIVIVGGRANDPSADSWALSELRREAADRECDSCC